MLVSLRAVKMLAKHVLDNLKEAVNHAEQAGVTAFADGCWGARSAKLPSGTAEAQQPAAQSYQYQHQRASIMT